MHQHPSPYSSQMNTIPPFPEHEHLNCPRCDSSNTKFCYYNNYNLLQPRHFCKSCRRYWTKGGTLRKIPIGGGTRKITKRSSTSNKSPTTSTAPAPTPPPLSDHSKPERSAIFDFSYDRGEISGGGFNLVLKDDLTTKLTGGSEEDDLNKTPATEVLRRNYLSVNTNTNHNQRGREESSGCEGGVNGWPDLSGFRSGSNFG